MVGRSYDRAAAVAYARRWALGRNQRYYNFTGLGGDCANFASQCLYAGAGVMNYKPLYGWYYNSLNDRTPSWSGVRYLYNFLVGNRGAGPQAVEGGLEMLEPGDIIQLATYLPEYHHTLVVTEVGAAPDYENTLICAHSYDSLDRPLGSYQITRIRFLHVTGVGA
jgi:hypothetical protein